MTMGHPVFRTTLISGDTFQGENMRLMRRKMWYFIFISFNYTNYLIYLHYRRRGIRWDLVDKLEDLDFADDLCLLSETHGDMQTKLEDLLNKAEKTGLVINVKNTKDLRINTNKTEPFTLRV